MRLIRADHVSLDVHDRARSIAWYQQMLGLPGEGRVGPPDEPVFLGTAGAQLGLFEERSPGLRHIAFATDQSGHREVLQRLEREGVSHRRERHTISDSIYFVDPDGVTLEVLVPLASAS